MKSFKKSIATVFWETRPWPWQVCTVYSIGIMSEAISAVIHAVT